jgi:hypothetical protein
VADIELTKVSIALFPLVVNRNHKYQDKIFPLTKRGHGAILLSGGDKRETKVLAGQGTCRSTWDRQSFGIDVSVQNLAANSLCYLGG